MPINYYLVIFKGIFADFFQFVPREITSCRPFWLRLLEILIGKIYMTEYKIDLYMPYNIGHINPYLNFRVMRGRIIIEKLCFWVWSGWNWKNSYFRWFKEVLILIHIMSYTIINYNKAPFIWRIAYNMAHIIKSISYAYPMMHMN